MITAFIAGIALGAILAISVGPVIFAIIKHSINSGFRAGMSFALGVSFSDILYVVLGNFAGAMVYLLEDYKKLIGIGGGILLMVMGIYGLFFREIKLAAGESPIPYLGKRDYVKIWISGFAMNALNPGVILFWLTVCTSNSAMALDYRFVLYGTCLTIVLGTDLLKVFLADRIRHQLTLKNVILLNRISAIFILIFGAILIYKVV
ncbi:MAG: LysE family translocator [Chitinophagaceae bacterium]